MTRFVCILVLVLIGGVPASAAELQYPLSIAAAADGTLYLADRNLPGVWQVTAEGTLSVYFQASKKFRTPLNAVRCVAVDAKGRLLAGDSSTCQVFRFDEQKQPQPLAKGRIGIPMAIAFNSAGEILVSDLEIHQVVKIPEAGGELVKVTESQACRGIAVDKDDRLWILGREKLTRFDKGQTETILNGHPFKFPHTIALDDAGNAYVSDNYAKAVFKIDPMGTATPFAQGAPFVGPVGICRHNGKLYVADPQAKAVFVLAEDGKVTRLELKPQT